ncbi:MAG: EAL domain-containing protein [Betaproteobacteria bacterium]|nr:EAL domain-containing protein [Betaproteobacteria bacterium]
MAYLLRFPFDLLKIDRAFVLEMMARDDARALVRTIVEMARTLGMETIAEGVEDSAQLEVLREAGCDAIQGYLVAWPMPLAQLRPLTGDLVGPARLPPRRVSCPLPPGGLARRTLTPVETPPLPPPR